ncbi:hypothetical protein GCM10007049_09660 [Echinicola pacifica]|uniref:Uncharacterized protein n=1 Tax=Echinicola pacifica TaxID=346377 RepID=A0A918PQI7_9BACT|nr:hypothetical protein [Echinicola pacifica]GGZ19351.1 hypothetical protein GCM10007049_09660 [Echinicola pacifica]
MPLGLTIYLLTILIGFIACGAVFFIEQDKVNRFSHRLLLLMMLIVLLFEIYASILVYGNGKTNVLIYNIFFVYIETIWLVAYIYLFMTQKIKRVLLIGLAGFCILAIVNTLFFQDIFSAFHNISFAYAVLFILICCILFFYEIFRLKRYQNINLLSAPEFWVITGVFFFYSSGFVYFIPIGLYQNMDQQLLSLLANINRILAGMMYLVFGFAYFAPFVFNKEVKIR